MKKAIKRQMKKPVVKIWEDAGTWYAVLEVDKDTLTLRNRSCTFGENYHSRSSAVKAAKRVANVLGVEYGGIDN